MPRKANLRTLHQPGHCPGVEDSAALDLARAIHRAESPRLVTSWSAQERAQKFVNSHGLLAALDEIARLEKAGDSDG